MLTNSTEPADRLSRRRKSLRARALSFRLKPHAAVAVWCVVGALCLSAWRAGLAQNDASPRSESASAVVIAGSAFSGRFDISQAASETNATWLTVGQNGGLALNTGVDRKAGGLALREPAPVGALKPSPGQPNAFIAGMGDGSDLLLSWHDGAPDATNGGHAWEWGISGLNNGFSVTLPGTATRSTPNTATVFTAAYCAKIRLTVHASDGTFADQTDSQQFADANIATGTTFVYNVQYRTNSPGATVTLEFADADAAQCRGQKGVIGLRGEMLRTGTAAPIPPEPAAVAAPARRAVAFVHARPAPSGVQALSEAPAQADAFVDSIGVMSFFGVGYRSPSPYYDNLRTAQRLLISSGIRHIRDHTPPYGYAGYNNVPTNFGPLQAAGVKLDFQTEAVFTKAQLVAAQAQTKGMIDDFEAPNEPNDQGNPDWINQTAGYQVDLASWIRNDPAIANVAIIGPSITEETLKYPNQSCCMDYGNSHGYQGSHNPETPGYGSQTIYGGYGSTVYNINKSFVHSAPKPIIYTECGYGSLPDGQSYVGKVIDYRAGLRYTPRLYFWNFLHGIPRTYQGQLLDSEPVASHRDYAQYGLIDDSMNVKPAYTAVSSIVSLLSDKGPAFTPKSLSYTLSGSTSNVYHALFEKRDGSYWLALWIGVSSWDADCDTAGHPACSNGDIIVKPQSVTLETTQRFRTASAYASDESGKYTAAAVSGWNGTRGSLTVTDKVALVRLTR